MKEMQSKTLHWNKNQNIFTKKCTIPRNGLVDIKGSNQCLKREKIESKAQGLLCYMKDKIG